MVLLQDTKLIDVTSKVFMFMKYIVRESQYNRLLSEDENKVKKYVRRRLPEIKRTTSIREFLNENENSKTKYIEDIVVEAKNKFMNKIKIFTNIDFEWLNGNDFVGEYEYGSSLDGEPKIYLYKIHL